LETEICSRLDLSEELLWRHARNFRYDRFSLDPLLPREGVTRLFYQWVRNSLTSGSKEIACCGPNFCTFRRQDEGYVAIDLVSVLDQGKGIGKALLARVLRAAVEKGAVGVHVTTECENYAAWNLYLKLGFLPTAFTSAFHLVRLPGL
jgi:GNAT superfamily N-acetyltransferase